LDEGLPAALASLKPLVGFSDLTTLAVYLWQRHRWPTFYGPMLAAGLDAGANAANGYDSESFRLALTNSCSGWETPLAGETLHAGSAEGILLGGAMTLLEATLGTPWEIDTTGAIVLLEDRGMKPYQVDRVLLHLKHAGKFAGVRAVILGDFPECEPTVPHSPSVQDVARRILAPLHIPVVFGAPVGHTSRPMLTLPLGVPARLTAEGQGTLKILEPTVRP
jgi:muramoyltetrapeptide carboxypeptidase